MGFERDAQLAFAIDRERGLRLAPKLSWSAIPFDELPQRRRRGRPLRAVTLEDVIDSGVEAPETWLEPSEERGRVLVSSEARLVVLERGERAPRQEGTAVEVPYGAVIRAGPVLLSPLSVEQADALAAGTLELPFVREGLDDQRESHPERHTDEIKVELFGQRRLLLAALLGLGLALLLALALLLGGG